METNGFDIKIETKKRKLSRFWALTFLCLYIALICHSAWTRSPYLLGFNLIICTLYVYSFVRVELSFANLCGFADGINLLHVRVPGSQIKPQEPAEA